MRGVFGIALIAASVLAVAAPASAENTLKLVCKCQKIVVNGNEQRSCAGQNDRIAVVNLDRSTLQWSNGVGLAWPAIPAAISTDQIQAGIEPGKARVIPGRLEISHYTISRITGDFEEDGLGHTTDSGAPNVDFIVPADVTGVCTKADAPKF